MSSVCLSLVATLRCSGLSTQQATGILIPPAIETFLLSFLIYSQWRNGRKHFLLIAEAYIYLVLCILDFSSKTNNSIATSLRTFSVYDRVIGGLSGIPIILYIIFLYFLSRQHLIPLLPLRFQWLFKVLLAVLIPVILALTEVGSLVGIGYRTVAPTSRELAVQFNSNLAKVAWTLFNSSGLALMILYQAIVFTLCLFRIFRQWTPSSSGSSDAGRTLTEKGERSERSRLRGGKTGGFVWICIGVKLGAIEALLGFIPNGFETVLARRLLRLFSRVLIAYGVFKGLNHHPTALFRVVSIDSLEGAPTRRGPANASNIRNLISAPISDTFAKMSPTAAVFHNKLTRTHRGDQATLDAQRQALTAFDLSFVDEKQAGFGRAVPAAVMPALFAQGVAAPSTPQATFPQTFTDDQSGKGQPESKRPVFPRMVPHDKRVTVAYNGVVAPVLDIRFSAQTFTDAGALLSKIKTSDSSSSDDSRARSRSANRESALKALRSRSTPPTTRNARDKQGMSTTPEEELDEGKIGLAITTSTPNPSSTSLPARSNSSNRPRRRSTSASRASSGRKSSTSRPRNLDVSPQGTLENPFTDASEVLGSSMSSSERMRMERQGSSGSDSIKAIKDLSSQFPSTPNSVETPRPAKRKPTTPPNPENMQPSLSSSARMQDMAAMTRYRAQTQAKFGGSESADNLTVQEVSVPPAASVASVAPAAPVAPLAPLAPAIRSRPRMDTTELSPTASLNNDVAIRTRRRLRSHLGSISDSPSDSGAQYATRPVPAGVMKAHRHNRSAGSTSNPTTLSSRPESPLFSAPMNAASRSRGGSLGGIRDTLLSPATEFNRDSVMSIESPFAEKPMGRIARRALGIERFLDEEKEKDQLGTVYRNDALDELAEATYTANETTSTPPGSRPGSKRRPRSNVTFAADQQATNNSSSRPYSPPDRAAKRSAQETRGSHKRRNTGETNTSVQSQITVEDPTAREAFAAAWRTVSPKVASPTVEELQRKMSTVNVKKTPAPILVKKHSSGQSMKADMDEEFEAVLPRFAMIPEATEIGSSSEYSPNPIGNTKSSRDGDGNTSGSGGEKVDGDRELMRKSRALRVASMDSDVY